VDKYERAALDFVNEVRVKEGWRPLLRLPKGRPFDSQDCPVAKALAPRYRAYCRFVGESYTSADAIACPHDVALFQCDFDCKAYPHLLLGDGEQDELALVPEPQLTRSLTFEVVAA
jgi:hypothetical protein